MKQNSKQAERPKPGEKPLVLALNRSKSKDPAAKPLDEAFVALIQRAHENNDYSVLRIDAGAEKMGRANSTFWADVKKGTVTPPIPVGENAVGWLRTELDAILAARTFASRANIPLDIKLFVSLLAAPRLVSKDCAVTVEGAANV